MSNDNFEFDAEINTDTEANAVLDRIVLAVAQKADKDDKITSIVVPTKMKLVCESYRLLRYMFGSKAKVSYTLHKPYKSVGYIPIEGKKINVKNPASFMAIVRAASNFEVFPTLNGKIVMNLTYHGLTQSIE